MTRYRITISGQDKAVFADLVRKYDIEKLSSRDQPCSRYRGYTCSVRGTQEIERMQQLYQVLQHEDADELGKIRSAKSAWAMVTRDPPDP